MSLKDLRAPWQKKGESREVQDRSLPTPIQLTENPELAALGILKASLEVSELALVAAYPESCEPFCSERSRSEQEAYAVSILYQIKALDATLGEYVESIERVRQWRKRGPSADDIPF